MNNEEKILAALSNIQQDMATVKAEINGLKAREKERELKDLESYCGTVEEQKEAWRQMSNLLTKEEGEALAAAVGE